MITLRSRALVSLLSLAVLVTAGSAASQASTDDMREVAGKLTFRRTTPGLPPARSEIWMMNADGTHAAQVTCNSRDDVGPAWSPDGRTIVFYSNQTTPGGMPVQYLYLVDVDEIREGCAPGRLLTEGRFASWSPVGWRIAFDRGQLGVRDIFVREADGSERNLTENAAARNTRAAWSPDGRKIVFARGAGENAEDIYVMNDDGSGLTQLTFHPAGDNAPQWSPDGRAIVFQSDRDGDDEIYVMNPDGSGQTRLTTHAGRDSTPKWSPDGRQIVFQRDAGIPPVLQLFVMNADGSGLRQVTDPPSTSAFPDWSQGRVAP